MTKQWIVLFAIAVAGCNNGNNGNGNHDMAMGGGGDGGATDMTPPGDMTDVTPIPMPTATHVGATGATCCLVTDAVGKNAAYLLNVAPVTTTYMAQTVHHRPRRRAPSRHLGRNRRQDREWRLSERLRDLSRRQGALLCRVRCHDRVHEWHRFAAVLSDWRRGGDEQDCDHDRPGPDASGQRVPADEHRLESGIQPVVELLLPGHLPPDGEHVARPAHRRRSHWDGRPAADRGRRRVLQLILPDDTLFFQDVVGGTGSPPSTPVQTLFWVKLGGAAAPAALYHAYGAVSADDRQQRS